MPCLDEEVGGERRRALKREAGLGRCERGSIFCESVESLLSPLASLVGDDAWFKVRFVADTKATLATAGPETTCAASSAAARSLLSWYCKRDSSGRMPFSRYTRSATRFWTTRASWVIRLSMVEEVRELADWGLDSEDAEGCELKLRILRIMRKTRFCK